MKRILLTLALVGLVLAPADAQSRKVGHRIRQTSNSYTTTFPTTENPISQGGRWVCGSTSTGTTSWNDMRVTAGLAFGKQDGLQGAGVYNDSVCMLTGTWSNQQDITGVAKATAQVCTGSDYEEVELLARWEIHASYTRGYEANIRNCSSANHYIGIVKWLGPSGGPGVQFTQLGSNCTSFTGLFDGDTVRFTVTGTSTTTLTVYINGVSSCVQTDSSAPWTDGNPGMGHWVHWNTTSQGSASDYGWKSYTVTAS